MKIFNIILLTAVFFASGLTPVSAGFGTGIGVTFPVSDSDGSSSRPESYAAFSQGKIIQELTAKERGGRLLLELKVTNDSDDIYRVEHPTGQLYDFAILDKNGKPLYCWSEGNTFTQALTVTEYPAHESVIYTAEVDRKTYRGIREDAVLVTAFLTDTSCRLITKVPAAVKTSSPVMLHGAIVVGNGAWYDDY